MMKKFIVNSLLTRLFSLAICDHQVKKSQKHKPDFTKKVIIMACVYDPLVILNQVLVILKELNQTCGGLSISFSGVLQNNS